MTEPYSEDDVRRVAEAIVAFDDAWGGCLDMNCPPTCHADRDGGYCALHEEGRARFAISAYLGPPLPRFDH